MGSHRRRLIRGGEIAVLAGVAGTAVAAELRHRRALAADDQYQTVLRQPLRGTPVRGVSADGTELYAEVFGPDDAPTFIMFPGWTEELHYFDLLTRRLLDRGYRVVCCDLRGQGSSGAPVDGDQRIERYGEDVATLLEGTCGGRSDVIIVGHSMGAMGVVAWAGLDETDVSARVRAAALLNTGVSDLVLTSTLLPPRIPEAFRASFGRRVVLGSTQRYLPVSTAVGRAVLRYVAFGPAATPGHVSFYEPMLWATPPQARAGAGGTLNSLDLRSSLARLTVPTLVIAGDVDRMTPASHAAAIAQLLPALAELIVLPATGHMAPLERPDEIVEALVRLAERTAVRS